MSATAGGGAVMMYASPYSSNGTSVVSPYEMPVPNRPRAKSCAGNDFAAVGDRERALRDNRCGRSDGRRHHGRGKDQVESQVKGARLKGRRPLPNQLQRIFLSRFRFPLFGLQFLRGEK
jgi:hypothetical protein